MLQRVLIVSSLVLSGVATARADVLVVGSGQPFAQIQQAVTASSDGDIVLVKAGVYGGFTIEARSLVVAADAGAVVFIQGGIVIQNVPPGKSVVLDRLKCNAGIPGGVKLSALRVTDCYGAIRVVDCQLTGSSGLASVNPSSCSATGQPDGAAAVQVTNAANVAFVGGQLQGGSGAMLWDADCSVWELAVWNGGKAGDGLFASNSRVSFSALTLQGGKSGTGSYSYQGGHGARASEFSQLVFARVDAAGGDGGNSLETFGPVFGALGGHGVMVDSGSQAFMLESEFAGGVQGSGGLGPGGTASTGIEGPGVTTTWPGSAKGLGTFNVLRAGQAAPLQVNGAPGEQALLFAAIGGGWLDKPAYHGTLLLDASALIGPIALGALTSEVLTLNITAPDLPLGLQGLGISMQAVLIGPDGATLSWYTHLTLLEASI